MKKIFIAIFMAAMLMTAAPAMAFGDIDNSGIMGDKNHHNTIINGGQGNTNIEKGAVRVENKNTNVNTNLNSNKNTNTNLNCTTNKNTNIQGQEQGQVQGQVQGQKQSANNEGVEQNITIIEAETKREHIGGSVFNARAGSYTDEFHYGAEFLPIRIITAFKRNFSYAAAYEDYGRKYGEGTCKTTGHSYNGRHEDDPSETIDVFAAKDFSGTDFTVVGFLTVKAVKDGTDSFMVMQKAILSAALMHGDAIIITSEGANMEPKSSGWGIGTFFSGGQVADHGNRGNATAAGGGTGFSKTSAKLVTLPWMTVQVIKYN